MTASYYADIDNPLAPARKRKHFFRYFSDVEGVIVDVGCSTGNFIQHAPERVVGVDIDASALAKARGADLRVVRANLAIGLPFASGSIQAVNLDSVIEHVHQPLALMAEIRRVLAPGGFVIVVTPDIFRVRERFWLDYTHVQPFCKESLERLAYDAGFRRAKIGRHALNYLRPISRHFPSWATGRQPLVWGLERVIGAVEATNIVARLQV